MEELSTADLRTITILLDLLIDIVDEEKCKDIATKMSNKLHTILREVKR